jgi:hypothetical protein
LARLGDRLHVKASGRSRRGASLLPLAFFQAQTLWSARLVSSLGGFRLASAMATEHRSASARASYSFATPAVSPGAADYWFAPAER